MWFFMNACYVLSLATVTLLLTGLAQSFAGFHVWQAGHLTFMVLASVVYFFTETLVIFFFVGTGVSIKEYTLEHQLDARFRKRSLEIKRRVYPPLLGNMLLMMILFVLAGAVEVRHFPSWLYQSFFLGCLVHYLRVKVIQNACFRENTNLIVEMSGIRQGC